MRGYRQQAVGRRCLGARAGRARCRGGVALGELAGGNGLTSGGLTMKNQGA